MRLGFGWVRFVGRIISGQNLKMESTVLFSMFFVLANFTVAGCIYVYEKMFHSGIKILPNVSVSTKEFEFNPENYVAESWKEPDLLTTAENKV